MTLAEHDELLKAQGRYDSMRARADEAERLRETQAAEWERAEQPLVTELRAFGLNVQSAWDLVNTAASYQSAIPILLSHLHKPYPDRVREGIARALAVPEAMLGWATLTANYRSEPVGTDTKTGLACALSAAATDEVTHEIIAFVSDRQHGESRILLLDALRRSQLPEAAAFLEQLKKDPELGAEAKRILRIRNRRLRR